MNRRQTSRDPWDQELHEAVTAYYRNHYRAPVDMDALRAEATRAEGDE